MGSRIPAAVIAPVNGR